jgi:tetratricopeptide (TPR) repeat protein
MKLAAALTIVLSGLLASAAGADEPKAEALARYEKGLELYNDKQFEKAIVELQAAYQLDARAEYLYAYAQAERLSGDCESAIPLYEEFLKKNPPADLGNAARELVGKCNETVAAAKPSEPAATPPPPAGSVGEPDDEAPRPWWKDPIGGALLGTGVIGLGVGATFWVLSSSAESDAKAAEDYQGYEENIGKAQTRRKIAIGSLAGGGLLVAGGIFRYLMLPKSDSSTVSLYFDGTDGGLVVAGEF